MSLAERKAFELVVETRKIVLTRIDECRSVVRDNLQDWDETIEFLANTVEEFDGLASRIAIGFDYVEDAP
jgi:hypothetical protein